MSKIYGFKYIVDDYMTNESKSYLKENEKAYLEYIIFSKTDGRCYIEKNENGKKNLFDITDNIDLFCQEIEKLKVDEWDMNNYKSSMEWFPNSNHWSLYINTDKMTVNCEGQGVEPPKWREFWESFNKMCNNEK